MTEPAAPFDRASIKQRLFARRQLHPSQRGTGQQLDEAEGDLMATLAELDRVQAEAVRVAALLGAVGDAANGDPVDDFMASHAIVRVVLDLRAENVAAQRDIEERDERLAGAHGLERAQQAEAEVARLQQALETERESHQICTEGQQVMLDQMNRLQQAAAE